MAIFSILILPFHEHGRSPSSEIIFNSLLHRLEVLIMQILSSLSRVTERYFILFVTILKGVVSLLCFSAYLSFVQKKATDLFELILGLFTSVKQFISFRSSPVEFWRSLIFFYSEMIHFIVLNVQIVVVEIPNVSSLLVLLVTSQFVKESIDLKKYWGQRGGSVVKKIYCPCRGPEFGFQHPH